MTEPRSPSLRWRLFSMLSASTLLVWLGVSWLIHGRLLHEIDEIYDAQLRQSGRVLAGIIGAGAVKTELQALLTALPKAEFDGVPQFHSAVDRYIRQDGKYERLIGFQIVDQAGTLLFRSAGAPELAFATPDDAGFMDTEVAGVRWRVCSVRDEALDSVIHIAEQYAVRQEITRYLLYSMRVPVLLGSAAVGVLIWLSVYWGLRPLAELARQVRNRKPDDLHALEFESAASEIRPIIDALNRLFARVRKTFEAERRFTGDAAHELRTPMAAMKVQSQVALLAAEEEDRVRALNGVVDAVDRATALTNQLLALSRLDWQQGPGLCEVLDLTDLAEAVAAESTEFASEKSVTVAGDGDPGIEICADEALAATLVRNLLDNAIHHSEVGGLVSWSVMRDAHHALLEIRDTGPGVPEQERQAVFERFHRLPGTRSSGAGLGLSIVKKIAELYDAEISLSDPMSGPGLSVLVRFPLAAQADGAPGCPSPTG